MLGGSCSECCGCGVVETFNQLRSYECSVVLSGTGPIQDAGSANGKYFAIAVSPTCKQDVWLDSETHQSGATLQFLQDTYPLCGQIFTWPASHEVAGTYNLALSPAETSLDRMDPTVAFVCRLHNTEIKVFFTIIDNFQGGGIPAFPNTKCQVICDIRVAWNPLDRILSQSESCAYSYRQFFGPVTGRDPSWVFLPYNREASVAWLTSQYENGTWRSEFPGGVERTWNNASILWWRSSFAQLTPYTISGGDGEPVSVLFQTDSQTVYAYRWVPGNSGKENFSYSLSDARCSTLQVSGTDTSEVWRMVSQNTSITPTVTLSLPEE